MTWYLDEEVKLETGPTTRVRVGDKVDWYMHAKQGVHFFSSCIPANFSLDCKTTFDSAEGEVEFFFHPVESNQVQ